jgi:hypothetical protein
MPTLQSIFGDEISVGEGHRQADREFTGYAGAHGLTSMLLGSRGRDVIVRGIVRGSGTNYSTARRNAAGKLDDLENAQWLDPDEYSFMGNTYYSVVWNRLELVPGPNGQTYCQTATDVIVQFIMYGISLI